LAYSQAATPPWLEHVPLWCWLKLYVPSTHLAVAPAGTVLEVIGRCAQITREGVAMTIPVPEDGMGVIVPPAWSGSSTLELWTRTRQPTEWPR
jgi:hypothetical protein